MAARDHAQSARGPLPAANRAALPADTKAADYYAARLRGQRLPEHEDAWCDLCGERATPADFSAETDMTICPSCIEDALDARTHEPRAEVGVVGGRH